MPWLMDMFEEEEPYDQQIEDAMRRAREQAYRDAVLTFQEEERRSSEASAAQDAETRVISYNAYSAATDIRKRKTVPVVEILVSAKLWKKAKSAKIPGRSAAASKVFKVTKPSARALNGKAKFTAKVAKTKAAKAKSTSTAVTVTITSKASKAAPSVKVAKLKPTSKAAKVKPNVKPAKATTSAKAVKTKSTASKAATSRLGVKQQIVKPAPKSKSSKPSSTSKSKSKSNIRK